MSNPADHPVFADMPNTQAILRATQPTTTLDLTDKVADLGMCGHTLNVKLPSGITVSLWFYEANDSGGTTSVDVTASREGHQIVLEHVVKLPGAGFPELRAAAIVIENRDPS